MSSKTKNKGHGEGEPIAGKASAAPEEPVAAGILESAAAPGAAAPETGGAGEAAAAGGGEPDAAELRRQAEEWKDKFLRAKAEQQNALRRAANEREEAIRYGTAQVLRSVLEVADDLDRMVAAAETAQTAAAVADGVRLVRDKVNKVLKDSGVAPIEAQGRPFDPAQHQAILRQPTPELPPDTVVQEVQKGYKLRDRVLRPTKVIVSAAPAAEEGGEAEQSGDTEEASNHADL